jgi:hypothetical protein
MTFRRGLILVLVAVGALFVTGAASAATVTVSPGGAVTTTSNGTLTMSGSSFANTICSFTLQGTIAVTRMVIAPNTSTNIGSTTGATNGACTGSATGIQFIGLPYTDQGKYILNSGGTTTFSGTTLNNLILILNMAPFGTTCLFSGNISRNDTFAGNSGTINSVTVPSTSITSSNCFVTATIQGTMSVSPGQTVTVIL